MKQNCFEKLYTKAGERLAEHVEQIPWEIYPRPHMERDSFLCLNGWWEFGMGDARKGLPVCDRQIRVPFVAGSLLSGVEKLVPRRALLRYCRRFTLPGGFSDGRVLLHIGAADQRAEVRLNGTLLGEHVGGYEPFCLDVTETISSENLLEILVWDTQGDTVLPYGKQRGKRGGMWYTDVAGIWQTVWLECVPQQYIKALEVQSDGTGATVRVEAGNTAIFGTVVAHFEQGDREFPLENGRARIEVDVPHLWSPEDPYLYRFTVHAGEDTVRSYFALRTLEIKPVEGVSRLCLNGKPYFFHGLLDQGYFSDGLFTPAEPEEYERDILAAKHLGFNMLRKHIKVEPERFYYDCDRLGMVVFQDMVNNGRYSFLGDTALPTVGFKRRNDKRRHRDGATRVAFLQGMEQTVRRLSFHPCICYWTIFNEGWGQFDHAAAYQQLKGMDATRFIDSVSGWFLPPKRMELQSDVVSPHIYFRPVRLAREEKPLVLSEFGGYSHKVEGHCFNLKQNYGYRSFAQREELAVALERLYLEEVLPYIREGLCAAVYTQLTDVEDETNGLLTYDRRVCKVDEMHMQRIAKALYREMK